MNEITHFIDKMGNFIQHVDMTRSQELKLKKMGPFTTAQAKKLGLSQSTLSRLIQDGRIRRIGRGLYLHPKALVIREIDFQIACEKFGPQSAVGGLSALFYYNLIEQVPTQTWVIVPPEVSSRNRLFRLVRTKTDVTTSIVAKDRYRIVSLERALIEGLKFSSKIGERVALKAVRTALTNKQTSEAKLGKMAEALNLKNVLYRYFEAITL
jgi:predicted transcriptional regulator of viral defense system